MTTSTPMRTRQSTRMSKTCRGQRQVQSVMMNNDDDGEDVSNNEGETETIDEDSLVPVSDEPEEQYYEWCGAKLGNGDSDVGDDLHQLTAVVSGLQAQVASTVATVVPSTPARDEWHGGSQGVRGGQRTMPRSLRSVRAMTRRPDDDDDGRSSSSSNGSGDDGSGSSSEESGRSDDERSDDEVGSRRGRHERRHRERIRISAKKSVKDLELPTFAPSPKMSVSTWIDRVDLALKGAEESGRGKWCDRALYFIMGNKLMDNAAKWWVNMNRRLSARKRTWTNLKRSLLRRYGEKLDKSAAEWRVSMRRMMPGETYVDFAAGLRDVVGRNKVSERVLLAQFYRWLGKNTKKRAKQTLKPTTLEDAVDKATEIDDPMDNVAQGILGYLGRLVRVRI
ncbi:unnamed protein product [Phytophthora fragariaefolia]|uniref:Unnamed protein product n=1 Tax=Phytophthora fragariaefolia TaxID=1490495 RepID=A0A9W7CWL7_9STRA|nr:unnamed protein product [Phytophthora fragariaefolia]